MFSGIGVLALALFIEWLRRRSRSSSPQSASITAENAKVSDSPVASGTGIVQNINSPTFNVSLPAAAPSSSASIAVAAESASVTTDEKAFEVELLGASRSIYTFERGDSPYVDIGATIRIHNRKDSPTTVFVRRIAVKVANGIERGLERAVMIRPGPISSIEDIAGFNSYEVPGCSSVELTLSTRKYNPSDLGEYLENSSPEIIIELGETFGNSPKLVGPMKFGCLYKQ